MKPHQNMLKKISGMVGSSSGLNSFLYESFTGHFLATEPRLELRVNFSDQQTRHHEWQLYLKYICNISQNYNCQPCFQPCIPDSYNSSFTRNKLAKDPPIAIHILLSFINVYNKMILDHQWRKLQLETEKTVNKSHPLTCHHTLPRK